MRPTPAERQAMRERWAASTPGEWKQARRDDAYCSSQYGIEGAGEKWVISTESPATGIPACSDADEDFIVAAHQDLPALLDALDEADREVARLKVLVAKKEDRVTLKQFAEFCGQNWGRGGIWLWYEDLLSAIAAEGAALVQAAGEGKS